MRVGHVVINIIYVYTKFCDPGFVLCLLSVLQLYWYAHVM